MTHTDGGAPHLSHLNDRGEAHMVDVGEKAITERRAVAESFVRMNDAALALLAPNANAKGDVFATARIAGIQAAKQCSQLIPLCHPLALTHVSVELQLDAERGGVAVRASCALKGRTGVEMEALTAASVAALTLFDMCKSADKAMVIGPTQLLEKAGGRSGHWQRGEAGAN